MAHMEEVLEGTTEHAKKGGKLLKNKKFLVVAGVVGVVGLIVYIKRKNNAVPSGTASFSDYPTPPQENGNIPTNVGSVTTGSGTNDPYNPGQVGNGTAPIMDIPGYQIPAPNIPQQQLTPTRSISDLNYAPGIIHSTAAEANYLNGTIDRNQAEAGLGNGGIKNGTAASETAGQAVRDRIASGGSSYVSAEIKRAQNVIANRQAEGKDTSLQEKYIRDVKATQSAQDKISQAGRDYNAAMSRGDTAGMKAAHDAANAARTSIGEKKVYDSLTDR